MNMFETEKADTMSVKEVIGPMLSMNLTPSNLKEKFLVATFEIVAEKGPEGLSASELIKRTDSSKGALFHHFKTLEELCHSSLVYFVDYSKSNFRLKPTTSLRDCLLDYSEDAKRRQLHKEHFHLAHFFRDRAMKDDRYQKLLVEAHQIQLNKLFEVLKTHLKADATESQLRPVLQHYVGNLESIFYQSVYLGSPQIVDEQILILIQSTENLLNTSIMASSAK